MKNKNCVYYCLYGDNYEYQKILELSVKSLSNFVDKNNIIIFSEFEISKIENYAKVIVTEFPKGDAIPMAYRLILGKKLLEDFDNVLHLDVDTLIFDNIDDIFNTFEDNKISFATEDPNYPYKIIEKYWAEPLLTEDEKIKYSDVNSICCGVFGFNKTLYKNLDHIYDFIVQSENSGFFSICKDQHGFVTYVLRNNIYNYNLQKYVYHTLQRNVDNYGFKIYHFAGGVSSKNKYGMMEKFLFDYHQRLDNLLQ